MNLDRFKLTGPVFTQKVARYFTLAAVFGFTILTIMVVIFPPTTLDRWFSLEVQEHGNAFFDVFMKGVSSMATLNLRCPGDGLIYCPPADQTKERSIVYPFYLNLRCGQFCSEIFC